MMINQILEAHICWYWKAFCTYLSHDEKYF